VVIPSQQSRTVSLDIGGRMHLEAGKWYHLNLPHQTSLAPVETEMSVTVPPGWRIAETAGGLDVVDGRRAVAKLVDRRHRVSVRLERTAWSRLWAQVRD
jgi:hypothetical protein